MRRLAFLALAACGSSHAVADAPGSGDGSSGGDCACDAPNVRGNVTAKLVDKTGAPQAGAHVVFIDTDTTVSDLTTDAAGIATASVFPGASVTAVWVYVFNPPPNVTCTTTVLDAAPGDVITLDVDSCLTLHDTLPTTPQTTMSVAHSSYAGASQYDAYYTCGMTPATKTTYQLAFDPWCNPATWDLTVVALNNSGTPLAYTSQSAIAFANGGSVTITDTWHALPTVTATYQPTTAVQNLELTRYAPYLIGAPVPMATADTNGMQTMLSVTAAAPARAVMVTYANPCATADATCKQMNSGSQLFAQVVDGTQTAYSLDLSTVLLPWLGYSVWNKATPTMLAMHPSGTAPVDIFEADMQYVRNNSEIYIWRTFGANAADVTFPALPADVPNAPTPLSSDTSSVTHSFLCESDAIAGYRAAVANPYAALGSCLGDPAFAVSGATLTRLSRSN